MRRRTFIAGLGIAAARPLVGSLCIDLQLQSIDTARGRR
jgi:hypothetical protein